MSARKVALTLCGLLAVVLAVYVPASALFLPAASPVASATGASEPTSGLAGLPEWSPTQFWVNFTVNGTDGQSGVFWTELYYQSTNTPAWTLYTPPWNPSGEWTGTPMTGSRAQQAGSILFDTYVTGGQDRYNFTSVATDRGYLREPGPPDCPSAGACARKAHTTVDTTPPVLFIARPTPGSWTNSETLQWTAQDAVSGVARVVVSVDGGPAQMFAQASGMMNMSLATQGAHEVRVTAADFAGNSFSVPIPFHYDTQAPSLQITSPTANAWLNATAASVRWSLADPAGIRSLQLSVDSAAPVALANTTTSYRLAGLAEALHVVNVVAVDAAGNLASQTVSFGVDTTAPGLQIVSPVADTWSNSHQIQAVWMASDAGSGSEHVEVSLDGAAAISLTNTAGYVFPNVAEGPHTVRVTVVDRAGNRATAASSVSVDYTPPSVVVTAPAAGSTVYGSPSVNWTAGDSGSGLARIVVIADGSSQDAAPGTRTMALPASLTVGPHAVTVQVWDRAGNMNQSTVAFVYGGGTPPGPGGSSLPAFDFWWVLAAVLAIAVVSAYLAVRRRRRKPS